MTERQSTKICFFIPSIQIGGAERHLLELRVQLRERGLSTDLVIFDEVRAPSMIGHPGLEGAVVLHQGSIAKIPRWVAAWRTFARLKPQLIIGINQTPFIVARLLQFLSLRPARVACLFHTTVMQDYETKSERPFKLLARVSSTVFYVSARQRAYWEQRGLRAQHSYVIPNGIDLARFQDPTPLRQRAALRQTMGFDADDYVIGIVAALRSEKNHRELLQGLAKAHGLGVSAKLCLIGGGELQQALNEEARALGVREHVYFAGEQSDVAPWIAACDVGALTSTSETFPLSALEFLARGRPMICTDVGGIPEIVHNNMNGLLYPLGDTEHLAKHIATLADDRTRAAMSEQALTQIGAFSRERMVDAYLKAFDELIGIE